MKRNILASVLLGMACFLTTTAQVVPVNPVRIFNGQEPAVKVKRGVQPCTATALPPSSNDAAVLPKMRPAKVHTAARPARLPEVGTVVYINDIYNNKSIGDISYVECEGGGTDWTYQSRFRGIFAKPGSKWVVTPLIALQKDTRYALNIHGYSANYLPLDYALEVKMGKGDNPDEYTTVIADALDFSMGSTTWSDHIVTFFPPEDDNYHVAFRVKPVTGGSDNTWVRLISVTAGSKATAPDSVPNIQATAAELGQLKTTVKVTTPNKNIIGGALNGLTRMEVYRNDTALVYSIDNPEPATEYTFEDNGPVNGFNTYTAICKNEDGYGPDKSTREYVGVDTPDYCENIRLLDLGNGKIRLTWDAPKGQNGGYVDPETVYYRVYRASGTKAYLLADSIKGYSFDKDTTYVGTQPGDLEVIGMAVNAFTDMGTGGIKATSVLLGEPYRVPYKESFAELRIETSPWTVENVVGQYSEFSFTEIAQDDDHGSIYLEYTHVGEEVILSSPSIDISHCKHPVLTYYYYTRPGQEIEQEVRINKATLEHVTALAIDHKTLTGQTGWRKATIDLNEYKDARYIRLEFFARIGAVGDTYCQYDNIQILDVDDYDLAVTLDAPYIAQPGQEITINAKVSNVGLKEVTDDDTYTLNVYVGDQLIATEEETDLAVNEEQVFSYYYTVPEKVKCVDVRAEVTLDKDANADNNEAAFNVGIDAAPTDTISDLTGIAGGNVSLTWSNPDDITARITDSFEDYPDFACDTIGNYTCINYLNPPSWVSRYIITTYYPHCADLYAYYIFNAHAEGYDQYASVAGLQARTGNKMLYTTSLADEGYERSDSWLISPELSGKEQTVNFWAKTYNVTYGKERIQLLYSTTDAEPQSFRQARAPQKSEFTLAFDAEVPGSWTQYGAYLPEGTKYFAIRYCSYDKYVMFFDDLTYRYGERKIDGYNIYRNGELIGNTTDMNFTDEDGNDGDQYTVTVVFADGEESAPSNVYVADGVTALRDVVAGDNFRVMGQQGNIAVTGLQGHAVNVYTAGGALIYKGAGQSDVNIPADAGIYLVVSGNRAVKVAVK